jgi:hypothetical protein
MEYRPRALCAQRRCTPLPRKSKSGQNVRFAHRPQACVPLRRKDSVRVFRVLRGQEHSLLTIWIVSRANDLKISVMKITKNIGMLLLAVYLIIDGLLGFGINFGPAIFLLYLVALAAGIFILIGK